MLSSHIGWWTTIIDRAHLEYSYHNRHLIDSFDLTCVRRGRKAYTPRQSKKVYVQRKADLSVKEKQGYSLFLESRLYSTLYWLNFSLSPNLHMCNHVSVRSSLHLSRLAWNFWLGTEVILPFLDPFSDPLWCSNTHIILLDFSFSFFYLQYDFEHLSVV